MDSNENGPGPCLISVILKTAQTLFTSVDCIIQVVDRFYARAKPHCKVDIESRGMCIQFLLISLIQCLN